ncbi:MAG: hypothetical protein HY721_12935 [Planctomycetes bacterium]|nr:hypothetical protein [Planctomycetota bacterium]
MDRCDLGRAPARLERRDLLRRSALAVLGALSVSCRRRAAPGPASRPAPGVVAGVVFVELERAVDVPLSELDAPWRPVAFDVECRGRRFAGFAFRVPDSEAASAVEEGVLRLTA